MKNKEINRGDYVKCSHRRYAHVHDYYRIAYRVCYDGIIFVGEDHLYLNRNWNFVKISEREYCLQCALQSLD